MATAALVARLLLGPPFVVFGPNGFLHFVPQPQPQPPPPGSAAEHFFIATGPTGYMPFVFAVQLACGLAFLAGLYVPLTLPVVAPVLAEFLLFPATMAPAGLPPPTVLGGRGRAALAGVPRDGISDHGVSLAEAPA